MTQERINEIAEFFSADEERAKKLIEMSPEDAVKEINAGGLDITVDELKEFGKNIEMARSHVSESGELDEDALSGVSGGTATGAALAALGIGIAIYYWNCNRRRW